MTTRKTIRQSPRLATGAALILAVGLLAALGGWSIAPAKKARYVKITPNRLAEAIPQGGSVQLTAVAEDENGVRLDPQPTFTWSCSADPMITVTASGRVTVKDTCDGCGGEVRATVTNADGSRVSGTVGVNGKPKKK
jgi:hypothetical protein